MRIATICVLLFVAAGAASASTTIMGGNIVNQTWTAANGPYIVEGDVTVPAGTTLTIEAGTALQFPGGDLQAAGLRTTMVEITVDGTLSVVGTAAQPVTMTGDPSGFYGIVVAADAASVVLNHVTVTGAFVGLTYNSPGSVLATFGLDIEGADEAMQLNAGSAAIDGLIVGAAGGNGIEVGHTAKVTLTNCLVHDAGLYGIHFTNTTIVTSSITNCTFDHSELNIANNSAPSTTLSVTNSLATNGQVGIYGATTVTYSDVWNNSTDNYIVATPGVGCISADPQYVSTTDYHLMPTSVAIDSGSNSGPSTDLDGYGRPVDGDGNNGAAWDMGAYEYGATLVQPGMDAGAVAVDAGGVPDVDAGGVPDVDAGGVPDVDAGTGGGASGKAGGCCQTGGGGGGAALLVGTVALLVTRRRRS